MPSDMPNTLHFKAGQHIIEGDALTAVMINEQLYVVPWSEGQYKFGHAAHNAAPGELCTVNVIEEKYRDIMVKVALILNTNKNAQ